MSGGVSRRGFIGELPVGKKLRFEIRPMDDWGNRGKPIVVEYVIKEV